MKNNMSIISVNIDKDIKDKANRILKDLGLNMSTFINMALIQVIKTNGIPFEITNNKHTEEHE